MLSGIFSSDEMLFFGLPHINVCLSIELPFTSEEQIKRERKMKK
jgi:hypothetical protein